MNVSVVKKKSFFQSILKFFSSLFSGKKSKYITVSANTLMLNSFKPEVKVEIKSSLEKLNIKEKIQEQELIEIRKLLENGDLKIQELALEEIENLYQFYIEENENLQKIEKQRKEEANVVAEKKITERTCYFSIDML